MQTEFLGKTLPSPIVLASGIWGTTVSLMVRAAELGCGAVTAKSCGPTPRPGHVNPTTLDWGGGLINAIGLANPGVEGELDLLEGARKALAPTGSALIASIFAGDAAEFGHVAARVALVRPDFIEVNISCPNVHSEFGDPFAADADAAAQVTAAVVDAVARQRIPVIVKLAPNVPNVGRIGRAVVEAGAAALCAINTMPGMIIDAESGQTMLANRSGGLSGPALKPVALKVVYDLFRACPGVPIIGTGGVTSGLDAIEMMMAGASLVGVGSAIYYRGPEALRQILLEMNEWLHAHGATLDEIWGVAHREPIYPAMPAGAPIPVAH